MKAIACMLVVVACIASTAGTASGQDGWKGTAGLIHLQDAATVGKGKLIFSLGTSYYKKSETLTKGPRSMLNYTSFDEADVDYHFFLSRAALTLGVSEYVEFSAALEVKNWIMQVGDEFSVPDVFETRTRGGIGDTDLLLKISPPLPVKYLRLGMLGYASFPTGRKEASFTTDKTDLGIKGLATVNLTDVKSFVPTKLHLNVGYRFNRNEDNGYGILYANNPDSSGFYPPAYPPTPEGESASFNDLFTLGTGIEFLMRYSRLFVEFEWESFLGADYGGADTLGNKNSYTITPGVSFMSKEGAGLTFAVDFNLNSDSNPSIMNPPDRMYYLMLSFGGNVLPQDQDKDGVADEADKCPDTPLGAFVDADGCPIDSDKDGVPNGLDQCPDTPRGCTVDEMGCPSDADGDGVCDGLDKCPDTPKGCTVDAKGCPLDGDGDGVCDGIDQCTDTWKGCAVDAKGCPIDTDGDGVCDGLDQCPDTPQGSAVNSKGCPGDTDGDGVLDGIDQCPNTPMGCAVDAKGCPIDTDGDGVCDGIDQCPGTPMGSHVDQYGCPAARPIEEKFILRGVNFESGSAAITPDSYAILDEVVKSLKAYPEVRVEIAGHTDNVGAEEYNMGLSQRRAESVKQYLMNAGISADRLVARGYGETSPIASNATPAGRADNRRIEFRRLN
jgi:outer membrane protein OmpA-like peptidoglycan-associated protein